MGYNYNNYLSMSIKNTSGFTLIELLIAVTLSAILMTGIVVFVSGMLIKRGLQVTTIYLGYSLPVIILVLGIMLMTKLYQKNPKA